MRRLALILALLLFAPVCRAQNLTTTTATVVDSAGTAYIQGTYTASLVNNSGQVALFGGNANFQSTYQGGLDNNGFFSLSLPSVTVLTPSGLQWSFFVCANPLVIAYQFPKPPLPCFTYTTTGTQISGTSVNLSASMTAVAAVIPKNITSSANNTFTGTQTFTGLLQCKNLETTRCVDSTLSRGGVDIGDEINKTITGDFGTTNAGTIIIAGGSYSFSTTINANGTNGIKIIGQASSNGGAPAGVALTYTGTGNAVTSQNSLGFRLSQVSLTWNNASFVGPLIALDGTTATFDNEIDHNTLGSGVPANNAPVILSMDKTENSNVHHNAFYHYVIAIKGSAGSSSFSNANSVDYNNFSESQPGGMAVTAHIQNPGQGWSICRNTFEMGTLAGTPAVINFSGGATGLGVVFCANWAGDAGTGTWTYFPIQGGGWVFEGNYFGGTTAGTTVISTPASFQGLAVKGNYFDHHATGIALGATNTQLDIGGNGFGSVTNFITGGPQSGVTQDGSNNVNIYSPGSFIDSSGNTRVNFTATNNQYTSVGAGSHQFTGPVWMIEQAAPSGFAGVEACYGDSTAHALLCSYNNAAFFKVPLVGVTNTWSAAQSFNSGTILPTTAGGTDLGSTSLPFGNLWLGTAATNNFKFQPAATAAARVISILDPGASTTLDLTSNTSTTPTQVLHASATAGVGTWSAIATADIATALTAPGPIGGTTPSTAKFTSMTATNLLWSTTAPTIAGAGCGGSGATISANNGTAAFSIGTGTAPTSACTVTMPAATTGWVCEANTVSATSTTNFIVKQTGAVSTTSVVLTLFTDVAATQSYTASDTIRVKCSAY